MLLVRTEWDGRLDFFAWMESAENVYKGQMAYLLAAFATAAVLFRRAAIVPPTDPPTATPMTTIQITLIINQNVVAFMLPIRFGSPRGDSSMRSISSFSVCKGGISWGGVGTSSPS